MIGVEGYSQNAVYNAFEREGIPTPGGGKRWDRTFFRTCILDDVYRPHTFGEVEALVSPEVAARLDRDRLYGIWWFNRLHTQTRQVSEPSENGRRYRKQVRATAKPKEEWIAVPVPYAGIPRAVVDAAREAIKDNRVPSSAGRRFWELSGGIVRCGECGNAMENRCVVARGGKYHHFYHSCRTHHHHGDTACTHRKNHRAVDLEADVWEFISGLLQDPERLRLGLDEMTEQERAGMRGDPEQEEKAWLDKLAEVEQERRGYLRLAAKGRITDEELDEALLVLEEVRQTAERELAAIGGHRKTIEDLERDRDALMESYERMVPEELDRLTPEERHNVYRMLRLEVYVSPNGDLDIRGAVLAEDDLYSVGNVTMYPIKYKAAPELRFRALLTEDGAERLELARAWGLSDGSASLCYRFCWKNARDEEYV